jgi:hypothetical protein
MHACLNYLLKHILVLLKQKGVGLINVKCLELHILDPPTIYCKCALKAD